MEYIVIAQLAAMVLIVALLRPSRQSAPPPSRTASEVLNQTTSPGPKKVVAYHGINGVTSGESK